MTSKRTQAIEALEKTASEAASLVDKAVEINQIIKRMGLCLPPIDPLPLFEVQRQAEVMLRNIEVQASRNDLPAWKRALLRKVA